MRVLLISHTCQSLTEGQPRAEALARFPDLELRVLVPDRWRHYGRWRSPSLPTDAHYTLQAERVAWPWAGPAQFYLHWYPGLGRIFREFQPDIIDVWEEPWSLVSAQACWLRNHIAPHAWIISETEQNINRRLPVPFEWFRAYTLRHADCGIGRSSEAVEVLRARGFTGPAEVIGNGVDTSLFRPLDRETCRQELGLRGFVAGYVGRLVEEKGLMDLVEALESCSPTINLLFVGSGPFQQALQERVKALGRERQAQFLPEQPLETLPAVMNALDCLVLPSRTTKTWKEQFGRVIIEAQACGTPVIGSDSGAIPEVVGKGGLIVPERDPPALGAAIERLNTEPQTRANSGSDGRQQIAARYTWEQVAERIRSAYVTALSSPPRSGAA